MFEKFKNRSEWKAFVCTSIVYLVAAIAHIFFDVELDETTMNLIYGQTAGLIGYAGSRGLAKLGASKQSDAAGG